MRFLKKVSIIMITVARIDPNGKRSGFTGRNLSVVTDTPVDLRTICQSGQQVACLAA
jgi:hypothetical protein